MKKRLFSIRIIRVLLITFLIGCLSQLTIILIRCSSIKVVEAPPSSPVRIELGQIPAWVSYNGNEYVNYISSNNNKIPEISNRKVGDVNAKSAMENNGDTRSVYKIDGTSENLAVAVRTISWKCPYILYFNKDYIWYYQKSKFDILLLLAFIDIVAVILSYNKFIKEQKHKTRILVYTAIIVSSLGMLEFVGIIPYVAMRTCSSIYMAKNYPKYHFKIYNSEYDDFFKGYMVYFESDNDDNTKTQLVISSKYFPISVVYDSMKSSE